MTTEFLFHPVIPSISPSALGKAPVFRLNVAELQRAFAHRAEVSEVLLLHFNLPNGVTLSLNSVSIEPAGERGYTWYGVMPDNFCTYALLGITEADDGFHFAGTLYHDGHYYIFDPAGVDHTRIYSLPFAGNMGATCGNPLVVSLPDYAMHSDVPLMQENDAGLASITVLALYPTAALSKVSGGEQGIRAIANSLQAAVNIHFQNSGIPARVSITCREHAELHHTDVVGLLREVVTVISDREIANETNFTRGPAYNSVAALRDAMNADIVALMATDLSPSGILHIFGESSCIPQPPRADHSSLDFATLSTFILANPLTIPGPKLPPQQAFVHEFGHLLGGQHSRQNYSDILLDPIYDFARGYVSSDRQYGTVMAYPNELVTDGVFLPSYSAAGRLWQGKVLGLPSDHLDASGKPDAADCASLFRVSTREVSRYRGKMHPEMTNLTLESLPATGGILVPSIDGPYLPGSTLTVTASQHVGHIFDHWEFNGKAVSTSNALIQITLGPGENKLHAYFNVKQETRHTLTVNHSSLPSGARIELDPPNNGPYPWGTTVFARYIPASIPDYTSWGALAIPATGTPLRISMIRDYPDFSVSRRPPALMCSRDSSSFVSDLFVKANSQGQYTWYMEDMQNTGPVEGRTLKFTIEATSTARDVQLIHSSAVTDANGRARLLFRSGKMTGSLIIRATLVKQDNESVIYSYFLSDSIQIWDTQHPLSESGEAVVIEHPSNGNQTILLGQYPAAVNLQFLQKGKFRANFKPVVKLNPGSTGVQLKQPEVLTDDKGVAQFVFTKPTAAGSAVLDFGQDYRVWLTVLPVNLASVLGITPPVLNFEVNYPPAPIALTLLPGVKWPDKAEETYTDKLVHLELDDGGTGLKLLKDKVYFGQTSAYGVGSVFIWLTTPQTAGQAFLRLTMPLHSISSIQVPINVRTN